MAICRSVCHSFYFVNLRFVAEVVFFSPLNFTGRFTSVESLL